MSLPSSEFQMIAKTLKGLENVLADELVSIGANDVQIQRRAVSFTGDKRLMYKANIWLRTALRVIRPIAVFEAANTDELYAQIKNINWEQYIEKNGYFTIDATVFSDFFRNSQYVTYRVKDGIADHFMELYKVRPSVKINDKTIYVNVHIAQKTVTVSLDSSGESLHKRGWRTEATSAPMSEVLAAGLLMLAGWKGETDFYDPMCGSGTLLIEAAMIALNIPPGMYRNRFAFEAWSDFDKELFDDILNEDSDEKEFTHHVYGSDAAFYAIKAAEKHVNNASLQKYISLHQCQLQNIEAPNKSCLVITNPPYGERMSPDDINKLYSDLGSCFKHKFSGSTAWVLSSNEVALKNIRLHPSEKIHLLNGELDCLFNKYELFEGERKEFKRKQHNDSNKRLQLSANRRENSQVSAHRARPFKTAVVQKRQDNRRPVSQHRQPSAERRTARI